MWSWMRRTAMSFARGLVYLSSTVIGRRGPVPNPRFRCSRRRLKRGQRGLEPSGRRSVLPFPAGRRERESGCRRRTREHLVTRHRSFKRLVRARMTKTGESYTAARAILLAAQDSDRTGTTTPFVTSDEAIRGRTGRGWEEWFDALDQWGAAERSHRDIARWVAEQLGIEPLGWAAQAITYSYERARGMRVVGERSDGFTITVSRTVAVPVDQLYAAFFDEELRARWLPDGELRERTATKSTSARFDWGEGGSRVHLVFVVKDEKKSMVALEHVRLSGIAEADRMKAFWRARLNGLKSRLEAGEISA